MFLGHYAVGFAAKRAAPRTSLGTLIAAGLCLDLIWPVLVLTDVERVNIVPGNTAVTPLDFEYYPFSHSLAMAVLWGILLGSAYFVLARYRNGALWVALLVVSHWFLDLPVHRPDLPLYPGGDHVVGLGLWNSVPLTLGLEYGLLAVGLWAYASATRPLDGIGRWAFWTFAAFLALIYAANLLGPPPVSVTALAAVALSAWLLVLWAWWFDRHRTMVRPI